MIKGDIYYRYGCEHATGVITWPEEILKREFATYKVVMYKITSDPNSIEFYDVIRQSDGPDDFLGFVELTEGGIYNFHISHGQDNWDLPPGISMREWVESLKPKQLPGAAIEGFIRASERKLLAQFNLAFETTTQSPP